MSGRYCGVCHRLRLITRSGSEQWLSSIPNVLHLGVLDNSAVAAAALLHALAVDTGGPVCGKAAITSLFTAVVVDVFDVKCVDMAGEDTALTAVLVEVESTYSPAQWSGGKEANSPKNGQANVDQEIRSAAGNGIDADGWD